jgi:WD40 repeat protein
MLAMVVVIVVVTGCGAVHDNRAARTAKLLRLQVPGLLQADQRRAVLYAFAAQRLDPTEAGNFALLSVDLAFNGVLRVLAPTRGSTLTALHTANAVISSDQDRQVTVWQPTTGQVLATVSTPQPIVRFAASPSPNLVASVDRAGSVALWNLEDPHRPIGLPLASASPGRRQVVALGFAAQATQLLVLTRTGLLYIFDVPARRLLRVRSLREAHGTLPWSSGQHVDVTAAQISPEEFSAKTTLLIATSDKDVARIDLHTFRGATAMPSAEVSGAITAVAESPYYQPSVILGTTAGTIQWNSQTHTAEPEQTGPNVGLALHETTITAANARGIVSANLAASATSGTSLFTYTGRPARALLEGPGGPVEIGKDGSISLIGQPESAVSMPTSDSESSTIADFGPEGNLLETSGSDANHIESLIAVRPGVPGSLYGLTIPNRLVRRYLPSKQWWPQDTSEPRGWFVDVAQLSSQYALAGGQDPTGTAVVLVWNAKTGKPLKRLSLTQTGIPNTTNGLPPSIVPQVELLPKKHLIAAYSAAQELIVLWSTDTWQQVATIGVGPIADFSVSPDENTILVTSVSDQQSGVAAGNANTRLLFLDVASGKVARRLTSNGTELAGYALNGGIVTVQKGAAIRQLNADGSRSIAPARTIEASQPKSLAWRSHSNVLAVGLEYGGARLLNLSTGEVSDALPPPPEAHSAEISFSPDGRLLAASNAVPTSSGYDQQTAPSIWNIGEAHLRQRACELSGGEATPQEWATWKTGIPFVSGCPADGVSATKLAKTPPPSPSPAGRRLEVAFQRGTHIEVASRQGPPLTVGLAEAVAYPTVQFNWSASGALAWIAQDILHSIPPSSASYTTPCPCSGVAYDGQSPLAVESDGQAFLLYTPTLDRVQRIPTPKLPRFQPTLLGFASDHLVVVGFPSQPERNTPSSLYIVDLSGHVRQVAGDARGAVAQAVVSPSGEEVAMSASDSGGACFSPEHLVILNVRTGRLRFPKMPAGISVPLVRSLSWPRAGKLQAIIAAPACTKTGQSLSTEPQAGIYEMQGNRLKLQRAGGYDTQTGASATATIAPGVPVETTPAGTLTLKDPSGKTLLQAFGVSRFSVRP